MSNAGLDLETITALLTEEKAAQGSKPSAATLPKPIQIGPLRYNDTTERCASRNCGTPTYITVKGIRYCSSHALYELNRLLLSSDNYDYSDCSCKAGMHSKMNIHTSDCPIWQREQT